MARIDILCGSGNSGRSAAVKCIVREHWGRALLLAPTRAAASHWTQQLILEQGLPGAWGLCVLELNDFARAIAAWRISDLESQIPQSVRTMDDFERRLVVNRCIEALLATEGLPGYEQVAAYPGFAAHLLRVITQLKQSAIEPDAFTERLAAAGRSGEMDRAVAAVYAAYQEALKAGGLYDMPGLFWEAELVCRARRPRLMQDIVVLALDGFDDFTPSQLRLLEAAALHVDRLVIGVNYDPDPDRQDLYALSAETVHTLGRRFGATSRYFDQPPVCGRRAYAARKVFWRNPPRSEETVGLAADLTVVPCADPTQEVEMIARRVKRLLATDGVAPEEVAVVYRRLGDTAATVRAVFAECGVPVRVLDRPRLAESAVGVFVLQLLDAWDGWEREAVLEVATSPLFGGDASSPSLTCAFPMLAREAGVVAGPNDWERAFALAHDAPDAPLARQAACALRERVCLLQRLERGLPQRAARERMASAFEETLRALGLGDVLERLPDAETAERERRALGALLALLTRLADTDPDAEIARPDFFEELRTGLRETDYALSAPPAAVTVCEAPSLRNLRLDYVFFAGLNEGLVPMPAPVNAIYSESDLDALREAGILLEGRSTHSRRERLLFHHVLDAARKRLTLSWHVQERGGREAGQSPFLVELLDLFPDKADIVEAAPRSDTFVPQPEMAASRRDLANCAFLRVPSWRETFAERFTFAERGAAIERRRQSEADFDAFDGVIADPALLSEITAAYGPEHCFSVSRIETYLDCPFRFFRDEILGIAPAEEPSAEFDPLTRGSLLHEALRRFHVQYRGCPVASIPEKEARKAMRRIVAEVFDENASVTPSHVMAVEQRRMETVLDRYITIELAREESEWAPAHFEVPFGGAPRPGSEDIGTEQPFLLATAAGSVRFAGRIDRIDENGDLFRIIDYKSGALPAQQNIKAGQSIQMGVYALAAEQLLLEGRRCAAAWFAQPGRTRRVEALAREKKREDAEARQAAVLDAIANAVQGIRAGRFPPTAAGGCAWCDAGRACRHEAARIARKTGGPTETQGEARNA